MKEVAGLLSEVGSDSSGGRPSTGNGDGNGRSDNTIPGLVPSGQALLCTPINCQISGSCGGIGVYFDYNFNWPTLHSSASATKSTENHDSKHSTAQGLTNSESKNTIHQQDGILPED
ncbi:hypothetical protein OIU74_006621 [Salix koriyanagi]|uniref:Uncharacterized protein n=1 Tax=Salix koriyanagi TaxID=2511006 RepID=A0A9Q0UER4_9ROSI|nr:hypothetical protein OIU74_006621 [Salix koriyanagi]